MMDNKLSELSKPVAWLAIYHGEEYDDAISITRSVVEAQANRLGWGSALTEIIPLYTAPPAHKSRGTSCGSAQNGTSAPRGRLGKRLMRRHTMTLSKSLRPARRTVGGSTILAFCTTPRQRQLHRTL